MAETRKSLDVLSDFGKAWAGVAALATVGLYALGYLSLRSHYTALGIDVDLGVFDDRYPFAGARFVAFVLASSGSLVIPLLVLAAVWHAVQRVRGPLSLSPPGWLGGGLRLVLLGLLAFAIVTFLQVLFIHNLLLDQRLPNKAWAAAKLVCWLATDPNVGRGDEYLVLGFMLLLLLTGLTVAWAWHEGWQPNPAPARRGLVVLLWLLAAFELMLLPVYHGTFFADTIVRRLEGAPDGVGGSAGDIWLVYRGNTKAVLFARDSARRPRLITVDATALNGLPLVGVAHVSKLLEMQGCPEP